MSVILESLPGYPIYCIEAFNSCPKGTPFTWETSRVIQVGERLKYIGHEENPNFKDHPCRWMITFETDDGQLHSAVDLYFVTEDCWSRLEKHFQERRLDNKPVLNGSVPLTT